MTGHNGQPGGTLVAAVSALLAVVLLAAVGVAALRSGTAAADTVLLRGADTELVLPDGARRAAVEGEVVPPGSTVRAGATGAVLQTRDREVHLGRDTDVVVRDGARQRLSRGFVLVDAADAPGVEVSTDGAVVDAPDGALVRVDAGALLRVGVLRGDGDPARVRPAGRRTTTSVPTYFSVQVPTGGLPGEVVPFALTPGDRYEAQLARDLVAADADLVALGRRLDGDTDPAGVVVLTALRSEVPADPTLATGAPGSEGALAYLIATAEQDAEPLGERYAQVRDLRSDGGSWGVVAAIVQAPVDRVAAALSALLAPGGTPALAAGGGPLDLEDLVGGGAGPAGPAPAAPGGAPSDPGPAGPPPPGPSPSPTPSDPPAVPLPDLPPGPLDPVTEPLVDTVEEVVDTVLDLLLPPSPAPGAPAPAPLLSLPPLLG